VGRPQRRGGGGLVGLDPLDRGEHRVGGLPHRRGHRGRGQQPGGDEGQVPDAADRGVPLLVDQRAQAQAHRAEKQQRGQQAAVDRAAPGPPVVGQPEPQLAHREHGTGQGRAGEFGGSGGHQSSSRRPVSRRNTSSSVLRRTREVSGSSPSARTPARVTSPSVTYSRIRSASTSRRSAVTLASFSAATWGRSGSNRSSSTSGVEYRSISSRGEPPAAIFPRSITTSRSQSCSASSM